MAKTTTKQTGAVQIKLIGAGSYATASIPTKFVKDEICSVSKKDADVLLKTGLFTEVSNEEVGAIKNTTSEPLPEDLLAEEEQMPV